MKKVLSAFFAVFLSMTGGYCENTSYVDTNLSSNDSMNSVISIRAIYESLNINKCFSIQSHVKDNIASIIGELISQGKNIRLTDFLSMCINLSNEDEDAENCIGCTIDIAKKHNELISKHEQEQINNIDVFTSEEEYSKVLKAKGYCTYNNNKRDFSTKIRSRSSCEEFCRNYAIANACVLDGTYFSEGVCYCTEDKLGYREWGTFKSYRVFPTWKDYKKLYKIK